MIQVKIISKNNIGLNQILSIINQLSDKNDSYLRRTFQWLYHKHPPFPNSCIVYNPTSNMYFHKKLPIDFKTQSWEEFEDKNWIRVKNFAYDPVSPFEVVIGTSNWILKLREENAQQEKIEKYINEWIDGYHQRVEEDRELFKSKLISNENRKDIIPLF